MELDFRFSPSPAARQRRQAALWYRDNNGMINYTSLNEMKRTHRAPYDSSTWSAGRWNLTLNVSYTSNPPADLNSRNSEVGCDQRHSTFSLCRVWRSSITSIRHPARYLT